MDTPIVLSHQVACRVLCAPRRQQTVRYALTHVSDPYGISQPNLRAKDVALRTRRFLDDCGVALDQDDRLDILVATNHERTRSPSFEVHVLGKPISSSELIYLAPGLFAVGGALGFIQAATWMEPLDLIKFGYELCGRYQTDPSSNHVGYIERCPLTNIREIRATLDAHPGMLGARRARRALSLIRENSRSPMESAMAMAIILPQSQGGLGYRNIQLNSEIMIPRALKRLTTSKHLEIDIYSEREHAGVEYDGDAHAELKRRTHDADRSSILGLLGISLRTITASHFANQLEFHRAMNSIARMFHIEEPVSREFQAKQNRLRLHLIESWRDTSDAI